MKVAVPALALLSLALAACGQTATPSSNLVTVKISMPTAANSSGLRTLATPTTAAGVSAVKAVKVIVTDGTGPVMFDANNAVSSAVGAKAYLTLTPASPWIMVKVHPSVTYSFESAGYDTNDFSAALRHLVAYNSAITKVFTVSDNVLALSLKSVLGDSSSLTTLPMTYVQPQQKFNVVLNVKANGQTDGFVPTADYTVAYELPLNGTIIADDGNNPVQLGTWVQVSDAPIGDLVVTAKVSGLVVNGTDLDHAAPGAKTVTATFHPVTAANLSVDISPPVVSGLTSTAESANAETVSGVVTDNVGFSNIRMVVGSTIIASLAPVDIIKGSFSKLVTNVNPTDQVTLIATDTSGNELRVSVPNALATYVSPLSVYVDSKAPIANGNGSYTDPFQTLAQGYLSVGSGGIIHLAAGLYTGVDINASKAVTIVGPNSNLHGKSSARVPEAVITGGHWVIYDNNTTLQGLKFAIPAVDGADAFWIQANNVTIQDNVFQGPGKPDSQTWGNVSGSVLPVYGKVYRGMTIAVDEIGTVVKDNLFEGLRQPAYINPGDTGSISGNHVINSRGWVSDNALVAYTMNTFEGTEKSDIALFAVNKTYTNWVQYCAITKLSVEQANPSALVDDQRDLTVCK